MARIKRAAEITAQKIEIRFDGQAGTRYGLCCMAEDRGNADSRKRLSVQAGDVVAYSRRFLQSIGEYTGNMPFARGKVTELVSACQTVLARIDWNTDDLPGSVNVANLSLVKDGVVMDVD